jgi:hypothetical protein
MRISRPTGGAMPKCGSGRSRATTDNHFRSALQSILQAELARGNRIRSAGPWPPTCRLLVLLDRPFRRRYALAPGVGFENLNDPHYWKAEYRAEVEPGVWECLACGF